MLSGICAILLVEDNVGDARLVQELLREARTLRCSVETAGSLADALRLLEKGGYSIVLTDLGLPDSQGLPSLFKIQEQAPELPTIVLTGQHDLELARQALQSGAQDYLPKAGISTDLLERSIRYAIDRKRAQQALARSEILYRTLFEQTMAPIAMISPDGRCMDANLAALGFFECTREEALGKAFWDYFPEEKRVEQQRLMEESADSAFGESLEIDCLVRGRTKTLLANIVSVGSKDHRTIFGIGQDITRLKEAERQLRSSLQGTIRTVSALTEQRDPYTSGHQRRVMELACSIADRLQWGDDRIAGLRAAGLLHDIGKVAIPAEILSKPRKLTDTEFAIIRGHSSVAYDILESIEFPWPVATAVRQHHERMDGSGYPDGLCGDAILLEARILAVADTVEAMSSHRPYRPALGIDAALEEIEAQKGRLYDAQVVDTCLSLFGDGGFDFC